MKKVIFIVEDNKKTQTEMSYFFHDKVSLIQAFSLMEADQILEQNSAFDLVIMDGCVPVQSDDMIPPYKPATVPLIKKIRLAFQGPMIATSSDDEYRRMLVDAGCDHECEKFEAPRLALQLLGL